MWEGAASPCTEADNKRRLSRPQAPAVSPSREPQPASRSIPTSATYILPCILPASRLQPKASHSFTGWLYRACPWLLALPFCMPAYCTSAAELKLPGGGTSCSRLGGALSDTNCNGSTAGGRSFHWIRPQICSEDGYRCVQIQSRLPSQWWAVLVHGWKGEAGRQPRSNSRT